MPEPSAAQRRFLKKRQQKMRTVTLVRILIFLAFLLLWEASARLNLIDAFIFSSPTRVAEAFLSMAADGSIFRHTGISLLETLISFFLVFAVSILISVLLWMSRSLSRILEPYLVVLNSLPKSALAPLLIVWLGANMRTIIVAGMSVAVFGSILTIYTGFQEVDPEKAKLIYTLGGRKKDVLSKVILPGSVPVFLNTMKVNIGLCLVGVIIGEFIGSREGLGYLIIYGSQVFQLDLVLMSIVILCILAMCLYQCLNMAERLYLKKSQLPEQASAHKNV
ncbi:sulfonate ABC transporter permease [Lachnoclostridium sp. An131]|uniref:ABC transporter permease n=1 Tax=Lachnoclostridium sp. An131 TaxID=1965555 RepID=UPI000B3918B2|nr:ABC transporter permease [Lachnoclostridium sp. An131]OUQ27827.1 sulfonate ABC transporter permease [Lachnoclostridium sp. An131]